MADKTKQGDDGTAFAPINFLQEPFFITVRQTPTRNVIELIAGDTKKDDLGLADLQGKVAADAKRFNTQIAVYSPATLVCEPPEEPDAVVRAPAFGS